MELPETTSWIWAPVGPTASTLGQNRPGPQTVVPVPNFGKTLHERCGDTVLSEQQPDYPLSSPQIVCSNREYIGHTSTRQHFLSYRIDQRHWVSSFLLHGFSPNYFLHTTHTRLTVLHPHQSNRLLTNRHGRHIPIPLQ